MDLYAWLTVLLIGGGIAGALWWSVTAAKRRKAIARRAAYRQDSPEAKTKRRLDTALRELRDLKEALPPSDRLRVERRRNRKGEGPGGIERRQRRVR